MGRKLNEGLKSYNLIRKQLSERGKESGQPFGKNLNSEASIIYAEFKATGSVIGHIESLIESKFTSELIIPWYNIQHHIESKEVDLNKPLYINTEMLGEVGTEFRGTKASPDFDDLLKEAVKVIRKKVENKSGLVFKVIIREDLQSFELENDKGNKVTLLTDNTAFVDENKEPEKKDPSSGYSDEVKKYRIDKEFEERKTEKKIASLDRSLEKGLITKDEYFSKLDDL